MPDSDTKLPVGIVNTIINTIAEFTKEMTILRTQLPNNEAWQKSLDAIDTKLSAMIVDMSQKLDRTLTIIKTVFILSMIVVGLSFLGAQILNFITEKSITKEEKIINNKLSPSMKEQISKELHQELKEIIERDNKNSSKH